MLLKWTLKFYQLFQLFILFVHRENMAQNVFDDMLFTQIANKMVVRLATEIKFGLNIKVSLLKLVRGH